MEKLGSLFLLVLALSHVSAEVDFKIPFDSVSLLLIDAASRIDPVEFNTDEEIQDIIFINQASPDVWAAGPQILEFDPYSKYDFIIWAVGDEVTMWFFSNDLKFQFAWLAPEFDDVEGHCTVKVTAAMCFRFSLGATWNGELDFVPLELSTYLSDLYASVHPTNNTEKSNFVTKHFEDHIEELTQYMTSLFGAYYLVKALQHTVPASMIWPIEGTDFAVDYSFLAAPEYEDLEDWKQQVIFRTNGELFSTAEQPAARVQAKSLKDMTFRSLMVENKRTEVNPEDLKRMTKEQVTLLGRRALEGDASPDEEHPPAPAEDQDTWEPQPAEESPVAEESPAAEVSVPTLSISVKLDSLNMWDNVMWQSPVTFAVFPYSLAEDQAYLLSTVHLDQFLPGLLEEYGDQSLFFVCHESDADAYEPRCEFRSKTDGPLVELYPGMSDWGSTWISGWGLKKSKFYFGVSNLIIRPFFGVDGTAIDFDGVKEVVQALFSSAGFFEPAEAMGNFFAFPKNADLLVEDAAGWEHWDAFEVSANLRLA